MDYRTTSKSDWNEARELANYAMQKKFALEAFEALLDKKGGMIDLAKNLLKCVHFSIENIYIRIEDASISCPSTPLAFAISLKRLSIENTNSKWRPLIYSSSSSTEDQEKDSTFKFKVVSIKDFSIFFNYCNQIKEKAASDPILIEIIRNDPSEAAFIEYADLDLKRGRSNRYLLNGFSGEARICLNLEAHRNKMPQYMIEVKVGESFPDPGVVPNSEIIEWNFEIDQLGYILKYLEYSGSYLLYCENIICKNCNNSAELNLEDRNKYAEDYIKFVMLKNSKGIGNEEELNKVSEKLEAFEKNLTITLIKRLRMTSRKALEFNEKKEQLTKEAEQKLSKIKKEKHNIFNDFKCN